jgi:trigger factor
MAVNVETHEKLERRITLMLTPPRSSSESRVPLKKLARTVKADGFPPARCRCRWSRSADGYSVQYRS